MHKLVIYLALIMILGYLIGVFVCSMNLPLREGARTLPRPIINPEYDADWDMPKSPDYLGETMNQMIDKEIAKYFDVTGLPYAGTIDLYKSHCVNKGKITEENRQKLTDVGYYLINIVIPNIPTVDNPKPTVSWPPIVWTKDKPFDILYQKVPTYELYVGQPFTYPSEHLSITSTSGDASENTTPNDKSSSNNDPSKPNLNDDNNDKSRCKDDDDCRLACPDSCLSGIADAWDKQQQADAAARKAEQDARTASSMIHARLNGGGVSVTGFGTALEQQKTSNRYAVGLTEVYGYTVTNIKNTSNASTLNDVVNTFIKKYFISEGANKNKPTKEAIDLFDSYFQYKMPMDEIHRNKLRDCVYYVLQSIIPGLPTAENNVSYVEWRPLRWLSRSEANSKQK